MRQPIILQSRVIKHSQQRRGTITWNTISSTAKSVSFVSGNAYFPIVPGIYSLTFRRKALIPRQRLITH